MTVRTNDLTQRIGSEVKASLQMLLDGSIAQELRALLERRGVLVFRGLDMTNEQQLQFAKTLGTPRDRRGEYIEMVTADKQKNADFAEYAEASCRFHFDDAHTDCPGFATILRARVIAPSGGQTEFTNTYAIYEDLTEDEQRSLDRLHALYSLETSMRAIFPNPTEHQLSLWGEKTLPPKTHPLVWRHRSGRKSLLMGLHVRVLELERAESDALVRRLFGLAERPEYLYRHEWQVGDVLIWDNTGTLHRAVPYDHNCGRELYRVRLSGEEQITAPDAVSA